MSGKHVDYKLRRILLDINSSLYLKEDYAFNSENFKNKTLEDYNVVFSNYFDKISELKKYYDTHLTFYYYKALR